MNDKMKFSIDGMGVMNESELLELIGKVRMSGDKAKTATIVEKFLEEKEMRKGTLFEAEIFVFEESGIEIDKPCHTLGYCPYGGIVEDFPIHGIAVKYAEEHDMFVKDLPGGGFVKCDKDDPDAMPDLNTILKQEL